VIWATASWWDHSLAPAGLNVDSPGSWKRTFADLGSEIVEELREWVRLVVVIVRQGVSAPLVGGSKVTSGAERRSGVLGAGGACSNGGLSGAASAKVGLVDGG